VRRGVSRYYGLLQGRLQRSMPQKSGGLWRISFEANDALLPLWSTGHERATERPMSAALMLKAEVAAARGFVGTKGALTQTGRSL